MSEPDTGRESKRRRAEEQSQTGSGMDQVHHEASTNDEESSIEDYDDDDNEYEYDDDCYNETFVEDCEVQSTDVIETAQTCALNKQVLDITKFRTGLAYSSPPSYVLKDDPLTNDNLVGRYDILWLRFGFSDNENKPPFFCYHRTMKGSVHMFIDEETHLLRVKVDFKYLSETWASTKVLKYSIFPSFDFIESNESGGSGMILDSIKNLTMKSNKTYSGMVAGGLGVLGNNESGYLFRDGYEKGVQPEPWDYEKGIAANNCYYNGCNSWMCNHLSVPPEIALHIRQFITPPPSIIFKDGDILIRMYWQTLDGSTFIYTGGVLRKGNDQET